MAKRDGIEKGIDLFEDYDNIPNNVQSILDKYSSAFEDGEYKGLENALKELNKIGYTFDYDLEGQAYDLRKTSQKGKSSYAKGGGFSSFMSNVKSLRKKGLSKTKEAYGKTKEYVKGKVHDQKKKIALDVIYDAKENLPIKREEINALDKAFRVVEEKYANGGGVMEKKYVIYELAFGQPYNFYNEEQDKFIWSEPTKATLFTKKEAENKRAELLKQRIEHYQSTGKHYRELHIGGKTNKEISDMYWQEAEDIDKEINSDRGGETSGPNWERIEKLEKERDRYRKLAIKYDSKMRRGGGVGVKKNELQKGYVALKSYWKVASKPSKLKEVPTTTISSIDRDAVINYLNSLEVISEYLEGNVPYTNPDVGYGPIEENYLLYDKEEGDIYFIDTQGYNYPRYITRLAGYKPKGSEEFKSGGGVGKKSEVELYIAREHYIDLKSFSVNKENGNWVIYPNNLEQWEADYGNKALDEIEKDVNKKFADGGMMAKGGGVGSQFEYTIGGL